MIRTFGLGPRAQKSVFSRLEKDLRWEHVRKTWDFFSKIKTTHRELQFGPWLTISCQTIPFSILLKLFSPFVQPLLISLPVQFSGALLCHVHLSFPAFPALSTHTHTHTQQTAHIAHHHHSKRNESECSDMYICNRPSPCVCIEQELEPFFANTGRQVSDSLSFILHLRQTWHYMPRKGWTALETPNGSFQLIRVPRPPSVRWEKAQPEGRGYKGVGGDSPLDPVKSTENRSPKTFPHRSRVDPEVAMENAQSKVARLQKALEAVGDMGGVVVESLKMQGVHREVRTASGLVGRRIEEALSEGRARLARLEDQRSRQPRPPPPQTEVRVEQLMEEISQLRQERDRLARMVVVEAEGRPDPKRVCRREDFVPMCDEEMHEWWEARQKDLHTEVFWTTFRGGEIVQTHGASCARVAAPTDCIVAVHPCAHGEVTSHQCGLNGVRVGEASHPGRRLFQRGRRVSENDSSSDEEPLWASHRNVVPRVSGTHLLPMEHNWMLYPGSCHCQRVHMPQRRRTQVPIVEGGESAVKVQTVDVQEWWERPSTMI